MDISHIILNLLMNIIPIISMFYIIVGIRLFKNKGENKVSYFSYLMFFSAIYSFGYFLELNAKVTSIFLSVRNFEYFGSVFIPTFGILFIGELTDIKISRWVKNVLYTMSLFLWILYISNPLHHLIYKSIEINIVGEFATAYTVRGYAFFSLLSYYLIFLISSSIMLEKAYKRARELSRKDSLVFLKITFLVPWLAIIFILLKLDTYIDPVPLTIIILACLFTINEMKNDMLQLQAKMWESTYENIGEPAFLVDKSGNIKYLNIIARNLLNINENIFNDIIENSDENTLNIKPVFIEIESEIRWFEVKKSNFNLNKKLTNYLLLDITDSIRANEVLIESEEKNRLLVTRMQQGLAVHEIILDENGKPVDYLFLDANESFEKLTGLKKENIIGKTVLEVLPETEDYWIEKYGHVAITGEPMEFQNYSKELDKYFEVVAYSTKANQFAVIISDITIRKKEEEEILYLSYKDQLTGLYNRRFYEEELKRLNTKRNLPLSLIMADVNGLKLINDSFGHLMGDKLLKKVGEVITKGCREDEIIARLGGDEFVILLPNTDNIKAEKIIKRINKLASLEKIESIDLSISFGYETKYDEKENIEDIFKSAEDYMYRSKLYESASIRNKTIDIIMNSLYEKSNREMLHSRRVSEICISIATKMNFSKDEINQIKIAGLMHDIGKMGIDEKILNKPESLTNEEWKDMMRHPEIGYRILSSSNEFSEIASYVLEHQERWDGKGYPKGLKGEEISLQARIIAVADAYDAMTSDRSYRKGLTEKEALEEIRRCSGTQFDPKVSSFMTSS